MQHRQQIRDQLGALEERLEELGALASANEQESLAAHGDIHFGSEILMLEALESMRELSHLVHEQQLFKSVNAPDFLRKICTLLIQDAASQNVDLSIAHFGEGKISLEMAELVMGAILAGLRASLKSQKGFTLSERKAKHLFPTGSIYIEVRATPGEILFRIIDDGIGFPSESTHHFDKLREHIGRCGGWFGHSSFEGHGSLIEFKVPLVHTRTESIVVRDGDFEVLIPSACVAEVISTPSNLPKKAKVFRLDEVHGMIPGGNESQKFLRVGVADLHFYLGCDKADERVKARKVSAEDFVEDGSWLKTLGVFQESGAGRALPLIDGAALVKFYKAGGGEE